MASSPNRPGLPARLPLLPLAVALAMAARTTSARTTNAVALFDQTVARGLPATVALASTTRQSRGPSNEGELIVDSLLDVELRFPGDVRGTMYLATWQGAPAVVTRSGDHLDISVPGKEGVDVTGFSLASNESHHVRPASRNRDALPIRSEEALRSARAQRVDTPTALASLKLPTLIFWMFIHDDVVELSREHIHAGFVAWWIADMKRILPTRNLWVFYSQNQPGMTDVPYGSDSSMHDWTSTVDGFMEKLDIERDPDALDLKFLLLTANNPVPGSTGQSWLGGDEGIASLKGRYSIVAHEYGHMLGAIHDDSEVRWTYGWPCETNMVFDASDFRSNCYRYSPANERRMRTHLAREWTVPVNPNPPEIPLDDSPQAARR